MRISFFVAALGCISATGLFADAIGYRDCQVPGCTAGVLTSADIAQAIGGENKAAVTAGTGSVFYVQAFANEGVTGLLGTKTAAGITGIGVKGPSGNQPQDGLKPNNEIDVYHGGMESLLITWASPSLVTELQLSFLFPQGEHDDLLYNEKALIRFGNTYTNAYAEFTLEATSHTTAVYSGSGAVNNLSPARDGNNDGGLLKGAALWQILGDDIAGISVNQIKLYAPVISASLDNWNSYLSDFSFTKLVIDCPVPPQEIPEPGTWLTLGAGLIGLGVWRRKR